MQRVAKRALIGSAQFAIAAYCVAIACWAIMRTTVLGSMRWIEFFSNLMPLLLLPTAACVLICALGRWRRSAVLVLLPVLVAAQLHGALFMPRSTTPASGAQTVRVASFNIFSRSLGIEEVIDVIAMIDADIIAIQEVGQVAADAFDAQLAARYPYRALHPQPGNNTLGQAVLSKYPITLDDFWLAGLGQQRIQINIAGEVITLYNVHAPVPFTTNRIPPYDATQRDAVIADLLARVAQDRGAVIAAGDFNMAAESAQHARIARQLSDTWRERGFGLGLTWPAIWDRPDYPMPPELRLLRTRITRIDYLWHNPALTPHAIEVWPDGAGSDHRPIVATFQR
jgi:vancomycin resistance protein VanJ